MSEMTAARTQRRAVSPAKQALRLTRTEFTLFYRYRVAAFFAAFPLVFVIVALTLEGNELVPGVDTGAYNLAGMLVVAPMMVAILHVSNVYAARREQLVLKRFRASGVPASAMFGATTLSVLGVAALLTAVSAAILIGHFGVAPADALLVLVAIVLVTVTVSLLAAAFTRLTRNGESAQMLAMVPFFVLYGTSGLAVPLDMVPEGVQVIARLLPAAPGVDIATSAYFGRDFFGGVEGAGPLSGLALWGAAVPSLLVLLAWLALSVYLLRFFRWDPREAK